MSRTYRRGKVPLDCRCGAPIGQAYYWVYRNRLPTEAETEREISDANRRGYPPDRICYCSTNQHYDYFSKKGNYKRDRKPWYKSSSSWKKISKRTRRAKEKSAMANRRYDDIPFFGRTNDWDWM